MVHIFTIYLDLPSHRPYWETDEGEIDLATNFVEWLIEHKAEWEFGWAGQAYDYDTYHLTIFDNDIGLLFRLTWGLNGREVA